MLDALDVVFAFMYQFWSFWRSEKRGRFSRGRNHDLIYAVRCSENHRTNRLLNSDGQCKLVKCFFNACGKRSYKLCIRISVSIASLTSKCLEFSLSSEKKKDLFWNRFK